MSDKIDFPFEEKFMGRRILLDFALESSGSLVSAMNAVKSAEYFCPACNCQLTFRLGKTNRPHFAHRPDTNCAPETITHKTAKTLIKMVVEEFIRSQKPSPCIMRRCKVCSVEKEQSLPTEIDEASNEYRLSSGHVLDVAILRKGEVRAGIEIRVTHPVDAQKLEKLTIPFIELAGEEVIKNPNTWRPLEDRFRAFDCGNCKSIMSKFHAKCRILADAAKIRLPTDFFRYSIRECYKCKREILLFIWPGDGHEDLDRRLHAPVPRTIQRRYSHTAECEYDANICPHCDSLQGRFHLHAGTDGPFPSLSPDEEEKNNFEEDLQRIAVRLHHQGRI